MARPNWSRPLPRPLVIPKVMTLTALADVRTRIAKRLPADFRDKRWRIVASGLLGFCLRDAPGEHRSRPGAVPLVWGK